MDADTLLDLAVRAAGAAGELLLERFQAPASGLASKSSRTDLVSDADRDAERLIVAAIRAERPGDAIVAEEGGGAADGEEGALRWLVDPLDGTINYLWGIPHWAVSLAVLDAGGGLVGVVHDPSRGETFTAIRGRGARLGERALTLSPAPAPALGEALVGTGFSYLAEERARQARRLERVLPAVRDVRRAGSAALDLAWVACGRLDGFFETALAPWDSAAGAIVVWEAGGAVADLPPSDGAASGIVAGRPGLLEPLRALVDASG